MVDTLIILSTIVDCCSSKVGGLLHCPIRRLVAFVQVQHGFSKQGKRGGLLLLFLLFLLLSHFVIADLVVVVINLFLILLVVPVVAVVVGLGVAIVVMGGC